MILPLDESELRVRDVWLTARYEAQERGAGMLVLRAIITSHPEREFLRLRLSKWKAEGFEYYCWESRGLLALCAQEGVVIVRTDSLSVAAFLHFESAEGRLVGFPAFVQHENALLIATEARVFCIQPDGYIRWIWSVRSSSSPHWTVSQPMVVFGEIVKVPVVSFKDTGELQIAIDTGFVSSAPSQW